MKKTVLFILIILAFLQTDGFSQKKRDKLKVIADTIVVNDSLEYELIVLDPGFDLWLATKPSKEFYSKEYYKNRNRWYVSEWNQRYMTDMRNYDRYETYIDYNSNTEYGLDLNYKLFYFFKYFEETNHVRLIHSIR